MEDYVMTMIKRTSIFMVLAQILLHFRPSPDYEKYFKFLTGMMTALMIFLPMSEVFQKGRMEEYQQKITYYMKELEKRSAAELPEIETPQQNYLSAKEEEIKCRLNKYDFADGYVIKEIKMSGIENGNIQIYAKLQKGAEDKICISKVQIGEKKEDGQTKEKSSQSDEKSKKRRELQKQIAELLEIEEECVEVELVE